MAATLRSVLALDVGEKRVGVAVASLTARLPRPLVTLERAAVFERLPALIAKESVRDIVIGFPRGLQGQPTAQTAATETFAAELRQRLGLPVHYQDEALTSKQAEAELQSRGKPYVASDIDALAATYILEDFLREHPGEVAA